MHHRAGPHRGANLRHGERPRDDANLRHHSGRGEAAGAATSANVDSPSGDEDYTFDSTLKSSRGGANWHHRAGESSCGDGNLHHRAGPHRGGNLRHRERRCDGGNLRHYIVGARMWGRRLAPTQLRLPRTTIATRVAGPGGSSPSTSARGECLPAEGAESAPAEGAESAPAKGATRALSQERGRTLGNRPRSQDRGRTLGNRPRSQDHSRTLGNRPRSQDIGRTLGNAGHRRGNRTARSTLRCSENG